MKTHQSIRELESELQMRIAKYRALKLRLEEQQKLLENSSRLRFLAERNPLIINMFNDFDLEFKK